MMNTTELLLLNVIEGAGSLDVKRLIEYIESYAKMSEQMEGQALEDIFEYVEGYCGEKNKFNDIMFSTLSCIVNHVANEYNEDVENFEVYVNGLDSWIYYNGENENIESIIEEL